MLSASASTEIAQKPDAPFLAAQTPAAACSSGTHEVTVAQSAGRKEDGIESGLAALFTEAERVARFGFTATELEREKLNIMRGLERASTEKDNERRPRRSPTNTFATSLDDEPIPGIVYEYALYAALPARRSRWPRSTRWPGPGCRSATASSWSARREKPG